MTFVTLLLAASFVNSDAWNFWCNEKIATLNRDGLRAAVEKDVDFYAQPGVEAVFYNMNFQRSFYPTKVGTPYWKDCAIGPDGKLTLRGKPIPGVPGEESPEPTYRQMFLSAKNMQEKFPEFMAYRYAYCHKKGLEMWHSMRMNDVHHATIGMEFRPQHGDLWLDHKECVRAWYRHTWRSEWNDNALDYGQKKVYDYHLAMAREYLMDYPNDGFEFDWLRSAPVFKPGFDEANMPLLTEFVRQVKKCALEAEKKWGHKIRLAHRVPARVRDAYGLGMDIAAWAKEGLVDVLIPGGVPGTSTEGDVDIAIYRALAPKPIVIAPELNCSIATRPGWGVRFDQAIDAGFVSGFYQAGADGIYFYNHFPCHDRDFPWVKDFFAGAADRAKVASLPRRHVSTWHLRTGEGRFAEENLPHAIWPHCCNGGVKINCGERVAGRAARVVFGSTERLDVDVLVNAEKCAAPVRVEPGNVPRRKETETFYYTAEIPAGALHDGVNAVEFFNNADFTIEPRHFVWLEVAVDAAGRVPQAAVAADLTIRGFHACSAARPQKMLAKDETVFACGIHDGRFGFRFDVTDSDVCVATQVKHPLDIAKGDRVEVYFVPDAKMEKGYRCAEIDASGRVLSYSVDAKGKSDWFWKFATLAAEVRRTTDGYSVSGSVSVDELKSFGVDPASFYLGVFRADMSAPGKVATWCSAVPLVLPANFHQPAMLFPFRPCAPAASSRKD